jgi:hypothetical protein
MRIRLSTRTTIVAALLAAGTLTTGGAVAHAAVTSAHGSAGTPVQNCRKWARSHTFVWINKAKGTVRTGLTVTGDMVTVHCGGPDDLQYIITNKPFTGHVLGSAKITVVTFANGVQFRPLPLAQFARWIRHDSAGKIFAVTGPFKAIRGLRSPAVIGWSQLNAVPG